MITVGELFAGIGGIGLGLEMTGGFEVKWQVEKDEYATRVLEKNWPDVTRWDDVCTFPPADGNWKVDMITGGFSCQDLSFSGKGAGLNGERSGLFYEIVRIASRLRPRYLLLENVSALLVRGLGEVLRALAEVGYDAEWHCIPAVSLGALHRRDRIFIIAYTEHDGCDWDGTHEHKRECKKMGGRQQSRRYGCNRVMADTYGKSSGVEEHRGSRQGRKSTGPSQSEISRQEDGEACTKRATTGSKNVADAYGERGCGGDSEWKNAAYVRESPTRAESGYWDVEPTVGRVADGIPSRVDRLRGLGNAVVPQVAQFIGQQLLKHQSRST